MANPLHGLEHGVMMVTRAIPEGSCVGNTYKLYARYASLYVKLWIDWAVQEMHGLHRFSGTDFFSLRPISWDPEAEFRTLLSFSVFYKFNSYILGLCLHFIINCKCHVCVSVLLRWCAFGQLSCHAWNVMKTRGPDCSLLRSSQSTSHRSRGVNPDILVKFQQV